MITEVSSVLPAPAEKVWRLLKRSDTLLYVTEGKTTFEHHLFPEQWERGVVEQVRVRSSGLPFAFGYEILFTEIDDANMVMKTREKGGPIAQWSHTMRVEPLSQNSCLYTDELDIIGRFFLTRMVVADAVRYYEYRHKRWLQLLQEQE